MPVGPSMTLTELLSPVQQLPDEDKIKLIRVFMENLDEGEEIAPLVPYKVCELPRPTARWERRKRCCRPSRRPTPTLGDACHSSTLSVATDDSQLANAAVTMGIAVENPVTALLRARMTHWEDQNLPAKGLPRILLRVHRWIEQHDPAQAAVFHSATQALSRLA